MAYFPNGTSFAFWQEKHCLDCLNYRDNGAGSLGCAITDVHFIFDYKRGTETAELLDSLIPDEGPEALTCRMRVTREDLEKDEFRRRADSDLFKYEAAMAEMRA